MYVFIHTQEMKKFVLSYGPKLAIGDTHMRLSLEVGCLKTRRSFTVVASIVAYLAISSTEGTLGLCILINETISILDSST